MRANGFTEDDRLSGNMGNVFGLAFLWTVVMALTRAFVLLRISTTAFGPPHRVPVVFASSLSSKYSDGAAGCSDPEVQVSVTPQINAFGEYEMRRYAERLAQAASRPVRNDFKGGQTTR